MGAALILQLSVDDLAIIDQAEVAFGPGLTALTGETGAGKSLLIDAIGLALGDRADTELVRSGKERCSVRLLCDVSDAPAAADACDQLGFPPEEGQIAIHREVLGAGRSTARINGKPATVGILKQIGAALVDLHGQHDHQALLDPERQLDFLDEWIGPEAIDQKEDVAERHEEFSRLKRQLNSLRKGAQERAQRLDMLRYQLQEIESASPQPNEIGELEEELGRLQHAEALREAAATTLRRLQESEEGAVIDSLSQAVGDLERVSAHDPGLQPMLDSLKTALFSAEDAARALGDYQDGLDADPQALEIAAERLDTLRGLCRKYGETLPDVIAHAESARKEIEEMEGGDQNEDALAQKVETAENQLIEAAALLTTLRQDRGREFEKGVVAHIRDLAMPKAEFRLAWRQKEIDANGGDELDFLFTANPGEPLHPMRKVASGGEMARVMLAVKAASAGRAGVPTLIFDEVDTGLSGRAAAVMATKLSLISQERQVMVISHLPQIAGAAATHFRIEKSEWNGRVKTEVNHLDEKERVREIARMLAGEKVGESALANARELLARQ